MLKTLMRGGIWGGIIIFLWGSLSWMVLPFHAATIHGFKDEAALTQAIKANAPQSGAYLLPYSHGEMTGQTPLVFASVHQEGALSMERSMIIGLISEIVAAFLVTWLLTKTTGLSYMGRVGFVVVFALSASIVTDFAYWNWFGFATNFTLVTIADLLIGWFLAGLAIAKITKR